MEQLKFSLVLLFILAGSAHAEHQWNRSVGPIFDLTATGGLGALHPETDKSVLRRSSYSIRYHLNTSDLDIATPHTVWVVAFNYPQYCHTTPCDIADFPFVPGHDPRTQATFVFAGGGVSDVDGTGTFEGTVYRTRNGVSGSEVVLGPGLVNPRGADIRLVLRSHGQPNPEKFEELLAALSSYRGACNSENRIQPPCRDYQISIHLPSAD